MVAKMIIVKTPEGLEKVVMSLLEEMFPIGKAKVNGKGIVFVELPPDKYKEILKIPEVEKAIPVLAMVPSELKTIVENSIDLVKKNVKREEKITIRVTRRGTHYFTSIDVASLVSSRLEEIGFMVDFSFPDKVLWIEIFGDTAYLGISEEQKLTKPKRPDVLNILRKISIIQMPYLGNLEAAYRVGLRIGRAAQAFEIGELIIAFTKPVSAEELNAFLKGILEGRKSRYEIQLKTYSRRPWLVPIYVYDLFQLLRMRRDEVFIGTSAKGQSLSLILCKKIREILEKSSRINVLCGAREGIPTGALRISKYILNFAPGITFATEQAITASIIALLACCEISKTDARTCI